MTQISVVIPTYNYAGLLTRAVESVVNQPGEGFEVIIVDDGSTDETESVANSLVTRFPSIISYTRQENQGPGAARNRGMALAKGEYILFLDADDELCADLFPRLRSYFDENPDVSFLLGGHVSVQPDGAERIHSVNPVPAVNEDRFKQYLFGNLTVSHGSSVSHRRVLEKIRYPESFRATEDIPVFAHSLALYECASLNVPFVRIYKHDDSLRHQVGFVKQAGLQLVDVIFDPGILPENLMVYRDQYLARRALSLFRSCFIGKDWAEADRLYKIALRKDPLLLTRWSYLSKYIRLKFALWYDSN